MQLRASQEEPRKLLRGPVSAPPSLPIPGFSMAIGTGGQDTGIGWWGRGWEGGEVLSLGYPNLYTQ